MKFQVPRVFTISGIAWIIRALNNNLEVAQHSEYFCIFISSISNCKTAIPGGLLGADSSAERKHKEFIFQSMYHSDFLFFMVIPGNKLILLPEILIYNSIYFLL